MTDQQKLEKVMQVIKKNKAVDGALIPVLHEVQNTFGYIPEDVQKIISKELNIPESEIYGVTTFYTGFSLNPKGKYKIAVCLGTACYVKGSAMIINKVKEKLGIDVGECTEDGKFSLDATRCLGACGLAPVMVINDKVYGRLTSADVEDILNEYANKE